MRISFVVLAAGWLVFGSSRVMAGQPDGNQLLEWFNTARKLKDQGDTQGAIRLFEKVLAEVPRVWGEGTAAHATVLNHLGILYNETRQFAKAEPFFLHCLAIREVKLGKDHLDTARVVNNMALMYLDKDQVDKAEAHFRRSLRIREAKLGKDHEDVGRTLMGLAGVLANKSEYGAAEAMYLRSLAIVEIKLGKDHPETAINRNNLAGLYSVMGRFAQAEAIYRRILADNEARFGKDQPETAFSLRALASHYQTMGDHAQAGPLYRRSLQITEAKLGKDHLQTALAHLELGQHYRTMGDYVKAEVHFHRSRKIHEAKLGVDHVDIGAVLSHLGLLYGDMGQYAKAEPLLRRSLDICEAKLGKDHADTATGLSNLAHLYDRFGQRDKAESLYLRSLALTENRFGKEHRRTATVINNLAVLYAGMGQHAKAASLHRRSLEICEAKFGKDHPQTAFSLNNLAVTYWTLGEYAKAEPLYRRSLDIREARLGKDHPDTARTLHDMALNFAAQDQWPKAAELLDKTRRAKAAHLTSFLSALTESELLTYLETKFRADFVGALALGPAAPGQAAITAEWLLNGKGIAHQSLAEQNLLARDVQSLQNGQLALELKKARARLAALVNRLPQLGQEAQYQKEMLELKTSEQDLAQKLARAVGRPYRANPWVTLDEVRAKLSPRTAFIDIGRFSLWDFKFTKNSPAHYVAWITPPKGKGDVQLIDLGEAEPIDKLVVETRKTLIESANATTKIGEIEALEALQKPLRALSAKVLHPLLPAIEKYGEWIVCPDGALWLTPWNALLLKDDKFAVEKHLIRHVVSGRDLVLDLPKVKAESAYIFADPDYDLSPSKVMAAAGGADKPRHQPEVRSIGSLGALPKVPRLPGTALEAEAIRPKLQEWLGQAPKVFLEEKASEALVKAVKNPRVLTLATHGYFLPAQEAAVKDLRDVGDGKRPAAALDKKGQPIENPLLRCGLLFAGYNRRAEAKGNEDDGILTGLEIIGMDLNGCELVVLSACETGLGDVRSGEGVAGLRQAFQLAGARSVLASLWQVPDRDTALLMNTFYGELAKGRGQGTALRQAQLQRIAARRDAFGAAHPFFWSAFALTSRGTE
jgi:CHAT domain-containing protein/tetratricopeptide (TPR) repeat protein